MRKLMALLLCIALAAGTLTMTGCAGPQENETETRTIVDMRGKTVEIPAKVENYCILYSSAVGICGMLDQGFANVRMLPSLWIYETWTYRMFPNLPEQAVIVNKNSVTAEQIVENGTQVVFWSNSSEELIESLESFGIACVNVAFTDDESLMQAVNILAEVFDTDHARQKAAQFCADLQASAELAIEAASKVPEEERLSVLILSAVETTTAFGKASYEYGWLSKLNVDYILPSEDQVNKVELTMEQVMEYDPDVIIFESVIDEDAVYSDPVWSELRAAKNRKLIANPVMLNVWAKSGMENVLTYKWAVVTLYPEYAGDIDLVRDTIEFCKKYFDYDMTEEEAQIVLSGELPVFD